MGIVGLIAAALQETRNGWTLPPDGTIDGYGDKVDNLFILILWITGVLFVLTEVLLVAFVAVGSLRGGRRAQYSHGHRGLELFWTIATAVILVWLALYQKGQWDKMKVNFPQATGNPATEPFRVQLIAKQFTWYWVYPGPDGEFATGDEYVIEKTLAAPADRPILIQARSLDVIHSLFIPYMRVKQDVVPGMTISIWFQVGENEATGKMWTTEEMRDHLGEVGVEGAATAVAEAKSKTIVIGSFAGKTNLADRLLICKSGPNQGKTVSIRSFDPGTGTLTLWNPFFPEPVNVGDAFAIPEFNYEIACAELCGGGHFKMNGLLKVFATEQQVKDFVYGIDDIGAAGTQAAFDQTRMTQRSWNWPWEVPAP